MLPIMAPHLLLLPNGSGGRSPAGALCRVVHGALPAPASIPHCEDAPRASAGLSSVPQHSPALADYSRRLILWRREHDPQSTPFHKHTFLPAQHVVCRLCRTAASGKHAAPATSPLQTEPLSPGPSRLVLPPPLQPVYMLLQRRRRADLALLRISTGRNDGAVGQPDTRRRGSRRGGSHGAGANLLDRNLFVSAL